MFALLSISSNQNIGETTMAPLSFLFCLFLIFGNTIPITGAGLLDPIRNIFGPISNHAQLKQFLSPFRNNDQVLENSDYDPNDSKIPDAQTIHSKMPFTDAHISRIPVDHSRTPFLDPNKLKLPTEHPNSSRLPLDNPSNSMLSIGDVNNLRASLDDSRNSGIPSEDPDHLRLNLDDPNNARVLDQSAWWPGETHSSRNPNMPKKRKPANPKVGSVDYDSMLAQKYPQAVKLLQQLKELNKLKDEQKEDISTTNTGPEITTEIFDAADIEHTWKPKNVSVEKPVKKLTKEKIYYQMKPVKPATDYSDSNETVYYSDG